MCAVILDTNKTYEDPRDGIISSAYTVIKRVLDLNFSSKVCMFEADTYYSKEARDAGKKVIDTKVYTISDDEFDTYFSDQVTKEPGTNILTQLYTYLLIHPDWEADWKGDE